MDSKTTAASVKTARTIAAIRNGMFRGISKARLSASECQGHLHSFRSSQYPGYATRVPCFSRGTRLLRTWCKSCFYEVESCEWNCRELLEPIHSTSYIDIY